VANQIAFTPDGKRALVASSDRSVRLYDVEGRRDLKRLIGHTASVWAVAFSTDNRLAISGSTDGTARVWDTGTGQELKRFTGHSGLVSAVAFAFDNKWGVSGGFDGSLVMWKVGSGDEVWRVDGLGAVAGIALDPKGRHVAVGVGKSVRLFDVKTGNPVHAVTSDYGRVSAVAFQPDGNGVVFGTEAGTIVMWDCADGPWRTMTGHVGAVRAIAVRDSRWLLSAGSDRSVKLWDAASEKDVAEFRKHAAGVVSAAFLSNGTQTISGDRDLNVLPWKIDKFFTATPVTPPPTPIPKIPDKIPVAKP
jgi:WD40 repeat protein